MIDAFSSPESLHDSGQLIGVVGWQQELIAEVGRVVHGSKQAKSVGQS